MKKKILILLLSIVVFSCKKEVQKKTHLLDFIPNNPTAIIYANSIDELQNSLIKNDFLQQYKNTKTYKKVQSSFKFLEEIESENEILISYATVGKSLSYLFAVSERETKKRLIFEEEKREYNMVSYQKIANKEVFVVSLDSVLVLTSSEILMENLIRNQKDNIKYSNSSLLKLHKASSGNVTFFLNTEKFPDFIKSIFPIQFIGIKNWLSFEFGNDNGLSINGVATNNNLSHTFASYLKEVDATKSTAATVIPENVTQYVSYNFEEIKNYKSEFENFKEIIDNASEVVSFQIATANLCAFKIPKTVVLDNLQKNSTYRNSVIYKNSYYKIPTEIGNVQPQFVCFLDEFMLLANTKIDLQNCIAHYQNETTLQHQYYFKKAKSNMLNTSVIEVGKQTKAITQKLSKLLNDVAIRNVKNTDYPLLIHQITYNDGYVQFNSVLEKSKKTQNTQGVSQLTSVVLDADFAMQMQWVTNHKTKQKELAVQDVNNVLYLISNKGKILWKKQLEGKIQGKIQQIDIYKNRKLQLAFTTNTEFMVIDRKGKLVQPFYKKFKRSNLLPLSVFDYDKTRDYRFLIVDGKNIFMYNNQMKLVKGFDFKKSKSKLLTAPKHVRLGTKDYIVFAEENGKIQILDRQGKIRTKVKNKFNFKEVTLNVVKNNLVFKDANNKIHQLNITTGKTKKIDILQGENSSFAINSKIKVKLEGDKLQINSKTVNLDYGNYTKPTLNYINRKGYIGVADLDMQKVYLYNAKGKLLPKFPVYGQSKISMINMNKDKYLEFAVQGESNSILIYKIK